MSFSKITNAIRKVSSEPEEVLQPTVADEILGDLVEGAYETQEDLAESLATVDNGLVTNTDTDKNTKVDDRNETTNEVSTDSTITSENSPSSESSEETQSSDKEQEVVVTAQEKEIDEPEEKQQELLEEQVGVEEQLRKNDIQDVVVAEVTKPVELPETDLFHKISRTTVATQLGGLAGQIEATVSAQCQLSGVRNLDLNSFGSRSFNLDYPNLSVIHYGKHFFLGIPYTEKERNLIVHKIALYINTSHKRELTLSAVQTIKDEHGMIYYSLLIDDDIAQTLADNFNYTIYTNPSEVDISKLVLHVKK